MGPLSGNAIGWETLREGLVPDRAPRTLEVLPHACVHEGWGDGEREHAGKLNAQVNHALLRGAVLRAYIDGVFVRYGIRPNEMKWPGVRSWATWIGSSSKIRQ
jgi:hypothetical protein